MHLPPSRDELGNEGTFVGTVAKDAPVVDRNREVIGKGIGGGKAKIDDA